MQVLSTALALLAALLATMVAGQVALSRQPGRGVAAVLLLLVALQAGTLGLQLLIPGLFPPAWRAIGGSAIPGLLFLLFLRCRVNADPWRPADAGHALPVLVVTALVAFPAANSALDPALLLIELGYALALLSSDRRDTGHRLRQRARLGAALLLAGLALVDAWIAWTLSAGTDLAAAAPLPLGALLLLAAPVVLFVWAWRQPEWLAVLRGLAAEAIDRPSTSPPRPAIPASADRALYDRFDALLRGQRAYAEFGIDLAQLARRLQVAPRQLSSAVNQVRGQGLRTVLNDCRVDDAARQLRDPALADKPITEVMFDAGFQTKSSFNKEFAARLGVSPSEYRQRQRASGAAT